MSNKILNTYAAYAFDDLIRKQSSSGAIFSLIAEKNIVPQWNCIWSYDDR